MTAPLVKDKSQDKKSTLKIKWWAFLVLVLLLIFEHCFAKEKVESGVKIILLATVVAEVGVDDESGDDPGQK